MADNTNLHALLDETVAFVNGCPDNYVSMSIIWCQRKAWSIGFYTPELNHIVCVNDSGEYKDVVQQCRDDIQKCRDDYDLVVYTRKVAAVDDEIKDAMIEVERLQQRRAELLAITGPSE